MLYNYNSTAVSFDWQGMNGVNGFSIFAANDIDRSDMVEVGDFGAGAETGFANLQAAVFGTNPFEEGTEVTFMIAAYNDAGLGPLSAGIAVTDEQPPLNTGNSQSGPADNDPGASPVVINLDIFSSEPLDETIAPSMLVLDGGDPFVLLPSAIHYAYIVGGVRLIITVPGNADASLRSSGPNAPRHSRKSNAVAKRWRMSMKQESRANCLKEFSVVIHKR